MAGPQDGWAYSKIELNAIWDLPSPSATDIAKVRNNIFEFHRVAGTEQDELANARITADTLAQLFDKEPPGMLPYPPTENQFLADAEDRLHIDVPNA